MDLDNKTLDGWFVATNPTPGTSIDFAVTTAFSETVGAYLSFFNNDAPSNKKAKKLRLAWIKLLCKTVPASGTALHYAVRTDNTPSRYASGGTAITPQPLDSELGAFAANAMKIYAGAVVLAAAGSNSNNRIISRGTLRGVIPTANDEYLIKFGDQQTGGSYVSAAASGRIVVNAPPLVVNPGEYANLFLWSPSNAATAPSFEFEAAGWLQ